MKISSFLTLASVSVLASAMSLPALASDAYGEPFKDWGFVKDDWQLVCDNTLTCRAAGYTDESAEWRGSILMTLKAGEKLPTTQVLLNYWDLSESEAAKLQTQVIAADYKVGMWLNDKYYGKVKLSADESGIAELTATQTTQLINHARKNTKIVFKLGSYQWQIPDTGLAAVLLKLDETQGRVGSPLALVSKNNANRQRLKPAKAIPKIYAAATYPITEYGGDDHFASLSDEQKYYEQLRERHNEKWQNKMSAWVIPTLNEEDRETCNILTSDSDWFDKKDKVWQFTPIDSQHTLASHPCWTAAYNFGAGYWLINNDKPNKPELITLSGSNYSDGKIFAAYKGRGISDCLSVTEWVWNGKKFVLASDMSTGMCRLIGAGGAWQLPTYVSEVVKHK